jgi:hypothetical protein
MPFIDPETHQFISPAEMAQRELRAAEASLAAIRAGLEERLAFEDVIALQAEYLAAQREVIRARNTVADLQSAAEQRAAAAREKEERARLRNLRARLGEFTGATRNLEQALAEVDKYFSRAEQSLSAIHAGLPEDVCLTYGWWQWDAAAMVKNASAVEVLLRDQIALAAAALRASGNTEDSTPEEDTNTVPVSSVIVYSASNIPFESDAGAVSDANNDVIGDTSTSVLTSTEE